MGIQQLTEVQQIILKLLADGYTQPQIAVYLKENEYQPHSLSNIEKFIKRLRDNYNAKTTLQLFVRLSKENIL